MRPFEIIATISPEVATAESLRAFIERGVTILRINGAHTSAEAARTLIDSVHESVGQDVDILLDFPGNKIRTKNLAKPRVVTADQPFTMCADEFNYPGFLSHLRPGNVLLANDSKLRFVVESCDAETAQFIADFDGVLEPNKGIHVVGFHPPLPFLLERDHELIQVAKDWGVDFLGLSFVRKAEDVAQVLELLDESPIDIICKIETREACERIDDILPLTSRILIDRGDLSSEIGMYNVPAMEDAITRRARQYGVKVFVATQMLYNMVQHPTPLMAEVAALHQAAQYADGIQLSDETAVGKYPLETIEVVREMRRQVVENGPGLRSNGDGPVIWITGRPGSGKTTLANALAAHLKSLQVRATQIDGDEARSFTQGVLGYSEEDRITNQRYLAYASKKAAEGGGVVIVASLSPYERLRQWARDSIPHYFEVYVDCPFEVCVKRDPKNHYARAFQGEIRDYPGVDMDYEVPNHPDCVVDTSRGSVDECMSQVIESLQSAGFLNDVARVSHDAGMPVSPPHS